MAEEVVKTVRIETGNAERTVKSLKKEISDLRDALLNMDKGGDEWVATAKQLTKAQEDLNSVMQAGKTTTDSATDSIVGMEQQYKALYNTYKLLSEEQRNSAEGLAMKDELSALSDNLNNVKKDVGNFKDNIGRYAKSAMDAFQAMGVSVGGLQGPLKLAAGATDGFGGSMKALGKTILANPIFLIVTIIMKIVDAFKKNEEATNKLKNAFKIFQPVIKAIEAAFTALADAISWVIEKLVQAWDWITSIFGSDDVAKSIKKVNTEEETAIKNAKAAQLVYEAQVRTLSKKLEILGHVIDAEKDEDKQLSLLTEQMQLQQELNEAAIKAQQEKIKQEELYLKQLENESSWVKAMGISAHKKHLDDLKNDLQIIEADGKKALNEIQSQIDGIMKKQADAAKKEKEDLDAVLDKVKTNHQKRLDDLEKTYKKEHKILEKHHKDTLALDRQYKLEREAILNERDSEITANLNAYRKRYESLLYKPSQEYFKESLKNIDKDINNYSQEIKNNFEKYGLTVDEILNSEKLLAFFNEQFPDALNKTSDELAKSSSNVDLLAKEFLDYFNAISGAGLKVINEVPLYLQGLKNEYAKLTTESDKYNLSLSATSFYTSEIWAKIKENDDYISGKISKRQYDINAIEHEYDDIIKRVAELKAESEDVHNNIIQYAEDTNISFGELMMRFKEFSFNNEQELLDFIKSYADLREEQREFEISRMENFVDREKELNEQRAESYFDVADASMKSFNSIANDISSIIKLDMESGKISEKEYNKKKKILKDLENIQLAATIASVVGDAASGIMGVWKSYGEELALNAQTAAATGPAAAATKAALDAKSLTAAILRTGTLTLNAGASISAAITKNLSNLNSIKGMEYSSDSTGNGVPAAIESNPYSYTRSLQTNAEREEELNKNYVVRVTDINDVQNRVKVVETESTF